MDGERLFYLRESSDLTQEQLGQILGVSKFAISKWENGKETISLSKLNDYANYFNVSMDYIFKNETIARNSSIISKATTNPTVYKKSIDKKEIGEKIKEIRIKNNLTQRDLAKMLNTTHSAIWAYEKGKAILLTSFAYQICKKYHISMDWLCGRK